GGLAGTHAPPAQAPRDLLHVDGSLDGPPGAFGDDLSELRADALTQLAHTFFHAKGTWHSSLLRRAGGDDIERPVPHLSRCGKSQTSNFEPVSFQRLEQRVEPPLLPRDRQARRARAVEQRDAQEDRAQRFLLAALLREQRLDALRKMSEIAEAEHL